MLGNPERLQGLLCGQGACLEKKWVRLGRHRAPGLESKPSPCPGSMAVPRAPLGEPGAVLYFCVCSRRWMRGLWILLCAQRLGDGLCRSVCSVEQPGIVVILKVGGNIHIFKIIVNFARERDLVFESQQNWSPSDKNKILFKHR